MIEVIYKYVFSLSEATALCLPRNAEVLHVMCQRNIPTMWVRQEVVNEDTKLEVRIFQVYPTGASYSDAENLSHVATFSMHDGDFIWHLFEQININNNNRLWSVIPIKHGKEILYTPMLTSMTE